MAKKAVKKASVRTKSPFKKISHQDDVRKPLIVPPRLLVPIPKLSVKGLLNLVDAAKREKAKDIAVKTLRTIKIPRNSKAIAPDTLSYRIQCYSKHNKHLHNVSVFVVDHATREFGPFSKVIVDCSCASHVYQCEMQLARVGNAMVWRSNGQPPLVNFNKNICKHTFTALRYMLRKQKYGQLPKKSMVEKKIAFKSTV